MVLIVLEAMSASSRPPAVDDGMRTSMGGRYGFGASAPLLARASPMHFLGAERGSVILPKLVKLVGFSSARADEVSSYYLYLLQRSPYTCESPCLLLRASVVRRGC